MSLLSLFYGGKFFNFLIFQHAILDNTGEIKWSIGAKTEIFVAGRVKTVVQKVQWFKSSKAGGSSPCKNNSNFLWAFGQKTKVIEKILLPVFSWQNACCQKNRRQSNFHKKMQVEKIWLPQAPNPAKAGKSWGAKITTSAPHFPPAPAISVPALPPPPFSLIFQPNKWRGRVPASYRVRG